MKKRFLTSLILTASVAATPPVAAQMLPQETGTRTTGPIAVDARRTGARVSPDRGAIVLADYATCLVGVAPRRAEVFVARFPDDEYNIAAERVVTTDCMAYGAMRFPPAVLRGALYRALYVKRFGRAAPSVGGTIDYGADAGNRTGESVAEYVELRRFADCVVSAAPPQAHALLISEAGSGDEKRAFDVLSPRFGPCLVSGVKARFSKEMILGLISEAAYRKAAVARAGTK